jgi:gas vesicle protein
VTLPLALSGDQWIAFFGVMSGAIVGVAGLVFAYMNGKAERVHGEKLARSERLYDQRREAYGSAAEVLEKYRRYIRITEAGMDLPDPDVPDTDDSASMYAALSVSASSDVAAALDRFDELGTAFIGTVYAYTGIRRQGGAIHMEEEARQAMEEAREHAIEAIDEAERLMREELSEL